MKSHIVIGLGTLAMLSACGKGKDASTANVSVADAVKTAQQAIKMTPGLWENAVTMEQPGAGPRAQTASVCITPEQVANPDGAMFAKTVPKECSYDSFTMADGKINSVMTCKIPQMGGAVKTTSTGTYSPTAFKIDISSAVSGLPGGQPPPTHMTMNGRRTGDCPAKAG